MKSISAKSARARAFVEIRHPRKRAFLAALAETGSMVRAAALAGVDRTLPYTRGWREDQEFQEGLRLAKLMFADVLEDEVTRRAADGVWKPTGWHKGKPGGYVREYSDLLLIFLLKGARPEKYRDRMEIRGGIANIDFTRLTDEQLARIAAGEHPLAVLAGTPGLGGQQRRALPAGSSGAQRSTEGGQDGGRR